jgi:hypothetical protein
VGTQYRPFDLVASPQADLAHEKERLRLENRILKGERDIQKRPCSSSRRNGHEVRFYRRLAISVACCHIVPRDASQRAWLPFPVLSLTAMIEPRSWTDHLLWHHAAHTVDLFAYQAGPIVKANAIEGPHHPELGIAMDM